ncbi:MAG: DNA repair protein RecO [Desulfohalobiaceae bacterium]|nr:DNA repair protein RecO [Desulfohalobiaceae bacterium]
MLSEEFSQEVVILKAGRFREADLWLRFFTPDRGVMTAFAFGGLRSRRRFSGCLEPLSRVLFKIARQRASGYYFLREGSLLDRFGDLHRHSSRLGMAVNCAKFVEAAHIGAEGSDRVYGLLLQTLTLLNEAEEVSENLPLYFRGRLTAEYGYRPDFGGCAVCGTPASHLERGAFSLARGAFTCAGCGFLRDARVLPGMALAHLDRILSSNPAEWGLSGSVQGRSLQQACLLLEKFVEYHMGLVWESGRFRPAEGKFPDDRQGRT